MDPQRYKTCTECKQVLPREAFRPKAKKSGRDPRMSRCRGCETKLRLERYHSDPEFREVQLERSRRSYRSRARSPEYWRRANLKYMYGLTPDDFDRLVEEQGGGCAICGSSVSRLQVDHCHESGVVRGLLCGGCNSGLGHMRDDPVRLRAAAEYVERSRSVNL